MFSARPDFTALCGLALLFCSFWGPTELAAQQEQREQVLAAYHSGVASYADFKRVTKFVVEAKPKWREIPWVPSLWQGVEDSQAKNKPMFLWAMNGDPLGCV